jgi:hypothetical protein
LCNDDVASTAHGALSLSVLSAANLETSFKTSTRNEVQTIALEKSQALVETTLPQSHAPRAARQNRAPVPGVVPVSRAWFY